MRFIVITVAVLWAAATRAEEAQVTSEEPSADYPRGVGIETNLLWPIFPGGISEIRVMVPIFERDKRNWRGEFLVGTYADFANRIVRDDSYGKVASLALKVGWRQFFVYGLHLEVALNAGWRHEGARPDGREAVDGFAGRLWGMAGWQYEFSRRIYANVRGGVGVHLWRTDKYGMYERLLTGGGDLNVGIRL